MALPCQVPSRICSHRFGSKHLACWLHETRIFALKISLIILDGMNVFCIMYVQLMLNLKLCLVEINPLILLYPFVP